MGYESKAAARGHRRSLLTVVITKAKAVAVPERTVTVT